MILVEIKDLKNDRRIRIWTNNTPKITDGTIGNNNHNQKFIKLNGLNGLKK